MDEHRAKNPEPYMPNSGLDDLDKIHVLDEDQRKSLDKDGGSSMDKDMVTKVLMADANMAVGKLITVDININNKKVQVPITFRLATATLTEQSITHLLALKTEDEGIVERYHAWRAGRIGLIKDLIFCQDLIDEHKKALMTDKDGVYSEIVKRVNNAKKYGILADNPSLVSASNIFIISEAVASQVELKLGGKLRNPRIREKAFLNTYAMILVVIDRDYDRATFYHRGIDMPTEVSFKEMKKSAQGKGPDIMDIMKAYNTGMPPSL
jgi:hypothetical protein